MTKASEQNSSVPKVQFFEIDEDRAGQRLDNFLIAVLKGVPKTLIYKIIRKSDVRVNKGRKKQDYRLQAGDVVRVPPVRVAQRETPTVAKWMEKSIEEAIIYEDDRMLIVNKPSGMAVHGGSGISLGLIEALRVCRPQEKSLELVHRLDRDTSGCLMVAKRRSALRDLHEQIRENKMHKVYWALVDGRWPARKEQVNAPLLKNELKSGERVVRVDPEGKRSLTKFKVLKRLQGVTLVEASPVTGRTHQIRVHAQYAGHSIIGDDKYTLRDVNTAMRERGVKRLFLHAAEIEFALPGSGERKRFYAPLPQELQVPLDAMAEES